jgi:hypothetical protein
MRMRTSKDGRLRNQRRAELLRSRIEELDQRLATLNSKRRLFEKMLDGVRELASLVASTRAQSRQRTTRANSRPPRVSRLNSGPRRAGASTASSKRSRVA